MKINNLKKIAELTQYFSLIICFVFFILSFLVLNDLLFKISLLCFVLSIITSLLGTKNNFYKINKYCLKKHIGMRDNYNTTHPSHPHSHLNLNNPRNIHNRNIKN